MLLLLLLNAGSAASSVRTGISHCLQTIIPALFPFMVASQLFLATPAAKWCVRVFSTGMPGWFGISSEGAPAVVLGAIGGYPVGARTAAFLWQSGKISKQEAEALLGFCSNAGPAFLMGMMGNILCSTGTAVILLVIHLLSAFLAGVFLARPTPLHGPTQSTSMPVRTSTLSETVMGAIRSLAQICGLILLFSILSDFLIRQWLDILPAFGSVLLCGLLELTGGCCRLSEIAPPLLRYCTASAFLAFGGLCVWMQTRAVTTGLSLKYFCRGKLLQVLFAVGLTAMTFLMFPQCFPAEAAAAAVSGNHTGLLRSTGLITGIFLLILGVWCMLLRRRAERNITV